MKYIRSRPWRSRGPWFSNRAGSRRRGFRADALWPVAGDVSLDGDDIVIAVESTTMAADDVLLVDAAVPMESMFAARVDVSGLRAIAARGAGSLPVDPDQDTLLSPDWFAHTEQSDDTSLSRHSA